MLLLGDIFPYVITVGSWRLIGGKFDRLRLTAKIGLVVECRGHCTRIEFRFIHLSPPKLFSNSPYL